MAMSEDEKERPVWLEKWMTEQDINELYSQNMQKAALAQLLQLPNSSIEWTDHSLRGVLGVQHASYRLTEAGKWVPQCSCGYKKDGKAAPCIHTFMLYALLKKVCHNEGWLMPGETEVAPKKVEEPVEEETPVVEEKPASRRYNQSDKPVLEVEADFNYNPCNVVVRFYVMSKGRRSLEDLCWIRDYGAELQRLGNIKGWNESDQAFLQWLLPIFRKRKVSELLDKPLLLSKDDFKKWMDKWGQVPNRIFDKATQRSLNEKMFKTPVRMQVEVYREKSDFVVGCAFYLDDGRKFFLHELVDMMRHDPTGYYIATLLKGYVPVVSWDSLVKYFGSSRWYPGSEKEMLDHLPNILENHLEVIGKTSIMSIHTLDEMIMEVRAGVDSRGSLALKLGGRWAGQGVHSGIRKNNGAYEVILAENKFSEKLRKSFVDHGGTRDANDGNSYYWLVNSENAARFRQVWLNLPKAVKRAPVINDSLKNLLSEDEGTLELGIFLVQNGLLVNAVAHCKCKGVEISPEEICQAAANGYDTVRGINGNWVNLAKGELSEFMKKLRGTGLEQGQRLMLPSQLAELQKAMAQDRSIVWEVGSQEVMEQYAGMERLNIPATTGDLAELLRDYQKDGIAFLTDRVTYGVGTILADDMGLGKTLETLTLLQNWFKGVGKLRALVISPSSVTDVWRREIVAWCSELRCVVIHGSKQERERQLSGDNEVYITSYALVRMDIDFLEQQRYDIVVLDEAQQIKNPEAQITECVKRLNSRCRLALTGTPLENRLGDVCSILGYVNPGSMDYVNLNRDAEGGLETIRQWLRLVMLRRTKDMVNLQLPPKTEEVIRLKMTPEVSQAYEQELVKAQERLQQADNRMQVLAELTHIRRFCCSPSLVSTTPVEDMKVNYLMEKVDDLLTGGHSVLVFSQFTSLLDLVKSRLEEAGHPYRMITGETPVEKRGDIVEEFDKSPEAMVFLLSLKAAGTGLTLTRADYVFLLDPWWNPSVENQAIDRTHRMGQEKPVFAYKLILADTVEENVMSIIEKKRALFKDVIDEASDVKGAVFSEDELRGLLMNRGK